MNREVESTSMRPLAKMLTRHLDTLRSLLREQCFRNQNKFTDKVSLIHHRYYYAVSQKMTHLQLAVTSTYID